MKSKFHGRKENNMTDATNEYLYDMKNFITRRAYESSINGS